VADANNNVIRKITPAGVVSTFAGSGTAGFVNGTGTAASFNFPGGVTIDASGNLYVSDTFNGAIRKITPAGVVSTFASGGLIANPEQIVADAAGNLYAIDWGTNDIVKITPAGVTSAIAGGFYSPFGLALDGAGNVYVSDFSNRIFKVTPAGVTTVFAGSGTAAATNGVGAAASFNNPNFLVADAAGNVYVMDTNNNLVRKITPSGTVTTLAGNGAAGNINGTGTAASLNGPFGVTIDSGGNLYVSTTDNTIRKISTTGYTINTTLPAGLAFNSTTGTISGTPTTVTAAKTYTIVAYNTGGANSTTVSIAVTTNPITFAAIPSKPYGTADFNPGATATGTITYTSGNTAVATIVSGNVHIIGAGSSVITATSGTSSYNQTLTVTKAPLTITANNQTMVSGATIPTLTVNYSGFVNGDTPSALPTLPTVSTTATSSSAAGTYPITASGAVAANYTLTYVAGTLTVTAAPGMALHVDIADVSPLPTVDALNTNAPNVIKAMSPNGDGKNDVLFIENIQNFPNNKLTLINQSGAKIFEATGYDNVNKVFDGHSNLTGAFQKPGTYYYMLQYHDNNGVAKLKSGYFVIKY